jgi:Tol biopolymer transport system component/DNA-binding winged helix-turn-helix (wHTH) protein
VAERELFRGGEPVPLTPKPLDTLLVLLDRHGHVVDKDELMSALWPDTFVEEINLVQQISHLRKVLGERPGGGSYIETVARRGYRFAAPVTDSWEEEPAEPQLAVAGLREEEARVAGRRRLRWILAVACILVIGAGVGSWFLFFRPAPQAELRMVPFTTSLGVESYPTISPDGKQVAFCMQGNIYVKQVGSETPAQRTDTPAREFSPAWSPDGRQIAFGRRRGLQPGFAIRVIDALGGTERTLYKSAASVDQLWLGFRQLTWSPNGEFLAFVERGSLFSLLIESREERRLTNPPQSYRDSGPAFSPDGRTLAFVRWRTRFVSDIYLLPLGDDGTPSGEPQRLTPDGWGVSGLDWTADGASIVFAGHRGVRDLWRIPVSSGEPRRLNLGDNLSHPSVSRQGDRLVCVKGAGNLNIWRTTGPSATALTPTGKGALRKRWIASTKIDFAPKYSRDGKKIAFTSTRSGTRQIWVCDSDGSNAFPLTSLSQARTKDPRWSPDGQLVAFESDIAGNADIYVVSAEGGSSRRLTFDTAKDLLPSWSKDGKWIYFGSRRGGDWQIWRIPSEGGTAKQVTRKGGKEAFESVDGKFLYYAKEYPTRGIWQVSVAGGEEAQVFNDGNELEWELLKDGICFLSRRAEIGRAIKFFRFASDQVELVTEFPQGTAFSHGFAVSPDGRSILWVQIDQAESDIMLVENFR